jgi:hypothetical protein
VTSAAAWKKILGTPANEVCVVTCEQTEIDDLARNAPKGTAVRVVRGNRCASRERTLQEWAAAFQFPSYFGNNWDAFEDCLLDLEWLNARRTVAIVTEADGMLPRSLNDFATLTNILLTAQKESPLLVVFQCAPGRKAALRRRLSTALKSSQTH